MKKYSEDAWLVPENNRLIVKPDTGETWAKGYEAAEFYFQGTRYHQPKYASEWLALTGRNNKQNGVGIYFDVVMFPELIIWLNRGFENVRRVRDNAFHIILVDGTDYKEDKAPFLPAEALSNEAGEYVIWIPNFYLYCVASI
jgi:hypothetical protein